MPGRLHESLRLDPAHLVFAAGQRQVRRVRPSLDRTFRKLAAGPKGPWTTSRGLSRRYHRPGEWTIEQLQQLPDDNRQVTGGVDMVLDPAGCSIKRSPSTSEGTPTGSRTSSNPGSYGPKNPAKSPEGEDFSMTTTGENWMTLDSGHHRRTQRRREDHVRPGVSAQRGKLPGVRQRRPHRGRHLAVPPRDRGVPGRPTDTRPRVQASPSRPPWQGAPTRRSKPIGALFSPGLDGQGDSLRHL